MQFSEAIREAELDEVRKGVDGLRDTVRSGTTFNPVQTIRDELRGAVEGKPAPAAPQPTSQPPPKPSDRPNPSPPQPSLRRPPPAPKPRSLADATARLKAERQAAAPAEAPLRCRAPSMILTGRRPRLSPSATGLPHNDQRGRRGRYRSVPGAASSRTSDRAALAAHQVARGIRCDVLRVLLLRPGYLQHPRLSLRFGGGSAERRAHRDALPRAGLHQHQAQRVRRGFPRLPGDRDADLRLRGAGPLPERAQGVPALPRRDPGSSSFSARWSSSSWRCRC